MNTTTFTTICLACVLLAFSGCTTKRQAYPNHTSNQVWVAMQAVAESPEYDDWHVTSNEVWVDQEQARIEVYREIRRTLHRPRAKPSNQRRTWRLQYVLEDGDPPTVRVVSRGMGVPAHALEEADRYLLDVRRMLQSEFATPPPAPVAREAPQAEPVSGTVPEIDIDDLD